MANTDYENIPEEELWAKYKKTSDAKIREYFILKYAPFGQGNPAPIFKTKADVAILTELKDGLHYKCLLTSPKTEVIGLFFNVEKDKFLQTIEVKERQEFTFSPGLA